MCGIFPVPNSKKGRAVGTQHGALHRMPCLFPQLCDCSCVLLLMCGDCGSDIYLSMCLTNIYRTLHPQKGISVTSQANVLLMQPELWICTGVGFLCSRPIYQTNKTSMLAMLKNGPLEEAVYCRYLELNLIVRRIPQTYNSDRCCGSFCPTMVALFLVRRSTCFYFAYTFCQPSFSSFAQFIFIDDIELVIFYFCPCLLYCLKCCCFKLVTCLSVKLVFIFD